MMSVEDIAKAVNGSVLVPSENEVTAVYTGDLLSDVMAHATAGSALVTIQNHLNTIAVSSLVGAGVVVLCHGREAPPDMMAAAEREDIGVVSTAMSQFEASLALAEVGPKG